MTEVHNHQTTFFRRNDQPPSLLAAADRQHTTVNGVIIIRNGEGGLVQIGSSEGSKNTYYIVCTPTGPHYRSKLISGR